VTTLDEFHKYGEELERLLLLRSSPIAVKMLEKEADIPKEAIRPKRDHGYHLAQCQAFTITRRQRSTVAMLKEDNWCWAPLIAFGLVKPPDGFFEGTSIIPFGVEKPEASRYWGEAFPVLEYGKYIGIVSAPLGTSSFEPDMVLIYSNTAQLRFMLQAVKYKEGTLLTSEFDPVDSCVYSVVPVLLNGQYRITLPDPGDYQRGLAGEDEIIFSVPKDKVEVLIQGLRYFEEMGHSFASHTMGVFPDFPQPAFYKDLFRMWGLDVQE